VVFVGDERQLNVGVDYARDRLAGLAHGGWLSEAADEAYREGLTGQVRVGPLGSVRGVSKLVEVQFRDQVIHDDCAVLTLRWTAIGPGGRLFPALDADITLTPAGKHATLLRLAGAYRPPLGLLGSGIDRVILHRVAAATIRAFIDRVADAITRPSLTGKQQLGWPERCPASKGAGPQNLARRAAHGGLKAATLACCRAGSQWGGCRKCCP
jgi:hypothetical protein